MTDPDEIWKDMVKGEGPIKPLNKELKPYLTQSKIGPFLNHPLVQSMWHRPELNAWANAQLEYKEDRLYEALERKDWETVLGLHEKPYRISAFREFIESNPEVSDRDYWSNLAEIYCTKEVIHSNLDEWEMILSDPLKGRIHGMTKDERKKLREMPNRITVYRGINLPEPLPKDGWKLFTLLSCDEDRQLSDYLVLLWTTSLKRAKWFANRFQRGNPVILEGEVKKSFVLWYLEKRGESEIVLRSRWDSALSFKNASNINGD